MLILIAKFKTKPEFRTQMIELAKDAITPSNNEEGCMIYEFLQDPFDPDSFTFYEKWRSREDLELHFEEPHFKEFAEKEWGEQYSTIYFKPIPCPFVGDIKKRKRDLEMN